ncbi:MAG: HAD-IA family hydrolase [Clostridia bacterium]|nr:HAD-IA family hydrolase [Clostridia bacterium]
MRKRGLLLGTEGVLCSTLSLHRQAWETVLSLNHIAHQGIDELDFIALSREEGLDALLALSGTELSQAERELLVSEKNDQYRQLLANIDASSLLPGVEALLRELRAGGFSLCLVTRSKNAILILRQLGLEDTFDAVCDGNDRYDQDMYHHGSRLLNLPPEDCLVWENSHSHREKAQQAGFQTISGTAPEIRGCLLAGRD